MKSYICIYVSSSQSSVQRRTRRHHAPVPALMDRALTGQALMSQAFVGRFLMAPPAIFINILSLAPSPTHLMSRPHIYIHINIHIYIYMYIHMKSWGVCA